MIQIKTIIILFTIILLITGYYVLTLDKSEDSQDVILGADYSGSGTVTFSTVGFSQFTPLEHLQGYVSCWGSGAGGVDASSAGGGGGGGGAFASSTVQLVKGTEYDIFIGTGGLENAHGATSTFATTTVKAVGGRAGSAMANGLGGLASECIGTAKNNGGDGGDGETADDEGGGGGGAGGYSAAGGVGQNYTGTVGGTGGAGSGGAGGAGGTGAAGADGNPGGASALGGGGGGGGDNGFGGGKGGAPGGGGGGGDIAASPDSEGGNGQCIVEYYLATSTTALNTPLDTATGVSVNPTFNFTGTDPNGDTLEYNIQVDTVSSFDGQTLVDSYDEANKDTDNILGSIYIGRAQSFMSKGGNLTSARFYLAKAGSPPGSAVAKLYALSGTYSNGDNIPTGSALAISDDFNPLSLSAYPTFGLATFTFTGAQQYTMVNGTVYVITIEYTGDTSNYIFLGSDNSSPSHNGNFSYLIISTWTAEGTKDASFYVYSTGYPLLSQSSDVNAGFTAGHPFASGVATEYSTSTYALDSGTEYFWRVAGKDTGTGLYGLWSPTYSFTTAGGVDNPDYGDVWIKSGVNWIKSNVLQIKN